MRGVKANHKRAHKTERNSHVTRQDTHLGQFNGKVAQEHILGALPLLSGSRNLVLEDGTERGVPCKTLAARAKADICDASTHVLQLVLLEVGHRVDDHPWDGTAEVDELQNVAKRMQRDPSAPNYRMGHLEAMAKGAEGPVANAAWHTFRFGASDNATREPSTDRPPVSILCMSS